MQAQKGLRTTSHPGHLKRQFFVWNGVMPLPMNIEYLFKDRREHTFNALWTWMSILSRWYFVSSSCSTVVITCCIRHVSGLRVGLQLENAEYDSYGTCTPIALQASICILFVFSTSYAEVIEGEDVVNACLYGLIDFSVFIKLPTDSSEHEEVLEHVCLLQKFMHSIL